MSTEEGTHGRWQARRAAEILTGLCRGPQRPLEHLEALRHARERIDLATNCMVDAARSEGANWAQIGAALGISRQAVRQAQLRRVELEVAQAEARTWRQPVPQRRARWRWFPRRAA